MTIRNLYEILAAKKPGKHPVLSVYLDVRPKETGQNPGMHERSTYLDEHLRLIEKTLLPRGSALDSLRADWERIKRFLDEQFDTASQGLAVFASSGDGLFETIEIGVPFENQVTFSENPDLFQLARLLDEEEVAVVAVVDTNTARLFVWRAGWFKEVDGPNDKNTKFYRKRQIGGWSQARYQRTIENNREAFATQSAAAIEDLVQSVGAVRLILAGDSVAIPLLKQALSPAMLEMTEDILRFDIRASQQEIREEIAPILAQAEADASRSLTDQLVGAIRSDGLGVAGLPAVRKALEQGQVDTLLLDPKADIDGNVRSELVRLAASTSADVVVVEDHEAFHELSGVGGILRYRI